MKLTKMAIELLQINEVFRYYSDCDEEKCSMYTFEQTWGNTSGGFEGIGGSAMTNQNTYVFIPEEDLPCIVFFGGKFAYKIPYSSEFIEDVRKQRVAGMSSYKKKYQ